MVALKPLNSLPLRQNFSRRNKIHRWYDPKIGRWISQDPIGFAAGDANLYRYVGNEATMYVDPDGLDKEKPWYNNDWTDWINPATYIAARGAALGDRIGDGASRGDNVRLIVLNARARQKALVNRYANASIGRCDDLASDHRAKVLSGILGRGLVDTGETVLKIADGTVASIELAGDVSLVLNIGNLALTTARGASTAAGAMELQAGERQFFRFIGKRRDVDPKGVLDIVVHGTSSSVLVRDGVYVNHRVLAKMIQANPQFTGQPIRLLSCNTGASSTGFAQNLANKLNVTVVAPNKFIFADGNGRHFINGGKLVGGRILPVKGDPGKFVVFVPGKQ